MAACKVNLSDSIVAEAQRQGVDPGIALAVARTESGVCQWRPDGSTVISSAGAIGIMQLMPDTARTLGVDPYDVDQNIRGGVTYLKQLFQKYGSWDQALAAYNWGPGKLDRASSAGTSIPGQVLNYVKGILGIGTVYNAALNKIQSSGSSPAPGVDLGPSYSTADILGNVIQLPKASVPKIALIVVGGAFVLGVILVSDD